MDKHVFSFNSDSKYQTRRVYHTKIIGKQLIHPNIQVSQNNPQQNGFQAEFQNTHIAAKPRAILPTIMAILSCSCYDENTPASTATMDDCVIGVDFYGKVVGVLNV